VATTCDALDDATVLCLDWHGGHETRASPWDGSEPRPSERTTMSTRCRSSLSRVVDSVLTRRVAVIRRSDRRLQVCVLSEVRAASTRVTPLQAQLDAVSGALSGGLGAWSHGPAPRSGRGLTS
jgi:hypothetical protein